MGHVFRAAAVLAIKIPLLKMKGVFWVTQRHVKQVRFWDIKGHGSQTPLGPLKTM